MHRVNVFGFIMTVPDLIGSYQALVVIALSTFVFLQGFAPITMWTYWADIHYYTVAGDTDTAVEAAAKIAKVRRSKWFCTWGLLVLWCISCVFLVACYYQVLYTYGSVKEGTSFTLLYSFLFAVVALDKCMPVMFHYFSYQKWRIPLTIFGAIVWGVSFATIFLLFFKINVLTGCLFIPYMLYNTIANLAMVIKSWGTDAYMVDAGDTMRTNVTPASIGRTYRSGRVGAF